VRRVSVVGASAVRTAAPEPLEGLEDIEFIVSPCGRRWREVSDSILGVRLQNADERECIRTMSGSTWAEPLTVSR